MHFVFLTATLLAIEFSDKQRVIVTPAYVNDLTISFQVIIVFAFSVFRI